MRIPRLAVVLLAVVLLSLPIVVSASDGFRDVGPDDVFHDDITWLAGSGITRGCNPPLNDLFCGTATVTRNQLAAFLHRLSTLRVVDAASVQGLDAAALQGQTGAQGPAGPQGEVGPAGETGPAGTTDHDLLSNIGTVTHAQLDTHVADATIHRSIDDASSSATALWSAAKVMAELAGKAAVIHSHVVADISDFVSGVDTRIAAQKGAANGLATLDGASKLPTSQLPAVAITDVYVVFDILARDTLTPERGDMVVVLNNGAGKRRTYAYDGTSWVDLTATSDVVSVSGKVGVVLLTTDDVAEGGNLYFTDGRVSANADVAAAVAHAADQTLHRVINDAGTSTTELWSASKIAATVATLASVVHTHVAADITDFAAAVDAELSTLTTSDLAEGSNLYYTEARVSANADVTTAAAHTGRTDNPHSVTKAQIGLGLVENLKSNLAAATPPGPTDDSSSGYAIGSLWIDTTNRRAYVAIDVTPAAALWKETSTADLTDLTMFIQDDVDTTKRLQLQLSGISPATTRVLAIPDANTTIVGTDVAQTLTNKTIDADTNTISNIANGDIKAGAAIDATKIADGSVSNTEFQFLNGVASNLVGVGDVQTLTNKTIDAANNTISGLSSTDVGLGNVANLKVNLAATAAPSVTDDASAGYSVGSVWVDVASDRAYLNLDATAGAAVWAETTLVSAGEANTASNVGTAGVGIFVQKTGSDLEFKNLNAGSSRVTVTDDVANDEIDVDVDEANIVHQNLSGAGSNTHAQIDAHLASTSNPHSVTKAQVGLGFVENLKANLSATAAPTATDDTTAGYAIGSLWIDTAADKVYVAVDTTASSAIWKETTYAVVHSHVAADISDFSSAVDARIAVQKGAANGIATLDAGGKVPASQLPASVVSVATMSDAKAVGTSGGSATSGSWFTRALNTIDGAGWISLASNEFTLQPGTYYIDARVPGYRVDAHQARLYNVTAASVAASGMDAFSVAASGSVSVSSLTARVTVAVATTFRIEHRVATSRATDGLGRAAGWGTEVYTTVSVTRMS